jgi:hypothetical protein
LDDGKKNMELRLADFDLDEGDILILEEYDPEKKEYTGRSIKKVVKNLTKWNPTKAHSLDEIKEYGFYEIELK